MSTNPLVQEWKAAQHRWFEVQKETEPASLLEGLRALQEEWERLFRGLSENAETSESEIWFCLGDAYASGRGTPCDPGQAKRWFRRAAEVGNTRAMIRLGLILNHTDNPGTHAEAVSWFRKAATAGDASGMVWLGFAYREGTGVVTDPLEAAQWFIKAVEAGNLHSMIHVGRMYARHLGSPQEAVHWFKHAAEAGFSESHIELALLYDARKSPVYNPAEAVYWYHKVAEGVGTSRPRAMLALARHYRDGIGVERSPETARAWLERLVEIAPARSTEYREAMTLRADLDSGLL